MCVPAQEPVLPRTDPRTSTATLHPLPGEYSAVEPPDPIPNSEVKRSCANGSVLRACESRSSPGPYTKAPIRTTGRGFTLRVCKPKCIQHAAPRAADCCRCGQSSRVSNPEILILHSKSQVTGFPPKTCGNDEPGPLSPAPGCDGVDRCGTSQSVSTSRHRG